jgi:hypothetical protein
VFSEPGRTRSFRAVGWPAASPLFPFGVLRGHDPPPGVTVRGCRDTVQNNRRQSTRAAPVFGRRWAEPRLRLFGPGSGPTPNESVRTAPMGTVTVSECSGTNGALAVTADAPADYNLFKFSVPSPGP